MSINQNKITVPTILVTAVIIIFAILLACFGGSLEYQFHEVSFVVHTKGWSDMSVYYDAIQSIELQDNVDSGRRIMGFGSSKFKFGSFNNSAFGDYTLYASTSCTKLVVLHMKDGSILALNDETDEATAALFAELNSRL